MFWNQGRTREMCDREYWLAMHFWKKVCTTIWEQSMENQNKGGALCFFCVIACALYSALQFVSVFFRSWISVSETVISSGRVTMSAWNCPGGQAVRTYQARKPELWLRSPNDDQPLSVEWSLTLSQHVLHLENSVGSRLAAHNLERKGHGQRQSHWCKGIVWLIHTGTKMFIRRKCAQKTFSAKTGCLEHVDVLSLVLPTFDCWHINLLRTSGSSLLSLSSLAKH